MRILTIVHRLGIGGTERTVQNFVLEFKRRGHAVAVLTTLEGGPREEPLNRQGVPTFIGAIDENTLSSALAEAERFEPDIIHIHRSGTPNPHETRILARLKRHDRKIVETSMFGRVDPTLGGKLVDLHCHVSRWNFWQWRRWMGRNAIDKPAVMIPNPIDVETFRRPNEKSIAEFRTEFGIPQDAFVLGRIARNDPHMWHMSNINSFVTLAKQASDAYFVGMGIPDKIKRHVKSLAEGIRKRIIDVPATTDDIAICNTLSAMDGFLHANPYGETFGLAPAEALLCDVPVVTVSRPLRGNGHLELLKGGKSGVAARHFSDLPRLTTQFYDQKDDRKRMAAEARNGIVQAYNLKRVSDQMLCAMHHTRESDSHVELMERIRHAHELVTEVSDSEIESILQTVSGRQRWVDRIASRFVFHPWGYRLYRTANSLRR